MSLEIGYYAFIDEAGDDGLKKIRLNDQPGASEWLVMSAIVIRAENYKNLPSWGRELINKLDQHQLTQLHYAKLSPEKRLICCTELAKLPIRIFTILSNKRNMEGYRNIRAEKAKINRTAWFYCWVSKLLMERVSLYCAGKTLRDHGNLKALKVIFSDRGGVYIDDIKNYYDYISHRSKRGQLHDDRFDLRWEVMDPSNFEIHPNKMRVGLQLADIAASSFFNGIEIQPGKSTFPDPAIELRPRMAMNQYNKIFGFGVSVMPRWRPNKLQDQQKRLIEFYQKI